MSPQFPATFRATLAACIAVSMFAPIALAQSTQPETIYWRQNLFLIPYQWSTANDAVAGQVVVLYVSKDRGATWQAISEAKPQVRAFNYRAEADGEYWFAIRTLDGRGNLLPAGPMLPELCVVVDTTIPRFEQLAATHLDDGTLDIRWRVVDANFDPRTCQVEVQVDRDGNWQPASAGEALPVTSVTWEARAVATLPPGSSATAVRVTAFDLARNRAVYQSSVVPTSGSPASNNLATAGMTAGAAWPAIISGRGDESAPPQASPFGLPTWVPGAVPMTEVASAPAALPSQPWPADRTADTPAEPRPAYATPPRPASAPEADMFVGATDAAPPAVDDTQSQWQAGPQDAERGFAPLEPFRQASMSAGASSGSAILPIAGTPPRNHDYSWLGPESDVLPFDATPKLVNSRTFALEYAFEHVGSEGVARVELWGTRDGGQTWRLVATDDDNRSPLVVTVDGEGLYGFRMVVESADGRGGFPPRPGDRPELWVGVDMHRPDVTLTDVERGRGEDADTLILRWSAEDDNLQSRPIAIFYSSRPTGPWTAIATNLANTGEYRWRLDRYLPTRVYLRLEARDTAGNVASYQTAEPIAIESTDSVARVSGVEPLPSSPPRPGHSKSR